jgi:hypothetical protein
MGPNPAWLSAITAEHGTSHRPVTRVGDSTLRTALRPDRLEGRVRRDQTQVLAHRNLHLVTSYLGGVAFRMCQAPPGPVRNRGSRFTQSQRHQSLAGKMPLQLSKTRPALTCPRQLAPGTPYARSPAASGHQGPFGRATLISSVRFEGDWGPPAGRMHVRAAGPGVVPDRSVPKYAELLTPHGVRPLPMGITPWGAADRLHTVVITRKGVPGRGRSPLSVEHHTGRGPGNTYPW